MIGFLSPILVHSEDSNTVCSGNATLDQQHQWTKTIYSQLLYWMSGQTAVSLVLVILSLVGEIKCTVLGLCGMCVCLSVYVPNFLQPPKREVSMNSA